MKRGLALLVCGAMLATCFTGCGSKSSTNTGSKKITKAAEATNDPNVKQLNVYVFTDEVQGFVERYLADHPEVGLTPNIKLTPTTDQLYQPVLDAALAAGGADAPDIYCAEASYICKYSQGDAHQYAAPYYDLGIDVDKKIKDAKIAQYSVDLGTNLDGNVVALGYQATGGCFIYRRSIAKDVFGTDDPKVIEKEVGPGWDKFFEAAEKCKAKGYAMVSGDGDIWHAIENSSEKGWVVDGKLYIDPKREQFLDYSKKLKDNGYHNDTQDWQEGWFADMKDAGQKKVFGFFGPAWLINYTLTGDCGGTTIGEGTYGDWAVTTSPIGFFWGGTWVFGNKDSKVKKAVGEIIEWITLDTSDTGLQYLWANNKFKENGAPDDVASQVVMSKSKATPDFLSGQDMFEYFEPANTYANGKNLTQYDEKINAFFRDQVREYTAGKKDRETAIKDFKQQVKDNLDIVVE